MLIRVEGLRKYYGSVLALSIDEAVVDAGIVAVVGPNGSGKTTLLSILAGLRYPSRGRLLLNGYEPYRERGRAFAEIGFMFDRPRLSVAGRVRDVVRIVLDVTDRRSDAEEYIEVMGLKELFDRRLHELSMGQAQLVGVFVALYRPTRIAVLDEPFSHLDVRRLGLLYEFVRRRGEIVFTTHVPGEAEDLADHIMVLDSGRLVWSGPRERLLSGGVYEVHGVTVSRERVERFVADSGGRVVAWFGPVGLVEGVGEEVLSRMVRLGLITGFRRAGVRRLYARSG